MRHGESGIEPRSHEDTDTGPSLISNGTTPLGDRRQATHRPRRPRIAVGWAAHMRRRRLFFFISVLSLVLCVAVCGLWVDSYLARSGVHWSRAGVIFYVATMDGRFYVG